MDRLLCCLIMVVDVVSGWDEQTITGMCAKSIYFQQGYPAHEGHPSCWVKASWYLNLGHKQYRKIPKGIIILTASIHTTHEKSVINHSVFLPRKVHNVRDIDEVKNEFWPMDRNKTLCLRIWLGQSRWSWWLLHWSTQAQLMQNSNNPGFNWGKFGTILHANRALLGHFCFPFACGLYSILPTDFPLHWIPMLPIFPAPCFPITSTYSTSTLYFYPHHPAFTSHAFLSPRAFSLVFPSWNAFGKIASSEPTKHTSFDPCRSFLIVSDPYMD